MKFLLLGAILSFNVLAGHGREGGGGNIESMRQAKALTKEYILKLLENNGALVKKEVLMKIPTYVTPSDLGDLTAAPIYERMLKYEVPLLDDLMFSAYSTDCSCPTDKDMCTENKIFAKVCFNVDNLERKQVNFHEFIGLLMHEHSHHFVGEMDHEVDRYGNNYTLAKSFEKLSQSNLLTRKYFTHTAVYVEDVGSVFFWAGQNNAKSQADFFCKYKGFKESVHFTKRWSDFSYAAHWRHFNQYGEVVPSVPKHALESHSRVKSSEQFLLNNVWCE